MRALCAAPPRSVLSQPRFAFCAAFERGLFVTSAMIGAAAPVPRVSPEDPAVDVRERGEGGCAAAAARPPRTGVKPTRALCVARRTRGVLGLSWLGMLSAVNTCGGTLSQSSKSSGARRFLPIDDDDAEAVMGSSYGWNASCRGWNVAFGGIGSWLDWCEGLRRDSGVRALKTVGGILASGVLGREAAAGVVEERVRELDDIVWKSGAGDAMGCVGTGGTGGSVEVEGTGGTGGKVEVEATGGTDVDAVGRGVAFGVESWLFAASLSCSDFTLRVRFSTLEVSFFFSLISL